MTGLLDNLGLLALSVRGSTFWLPQQGSSVSGGAQGIDAAFYFIYWVCFFFFFLIVIWLGWFCWVYRKRPGHTPQETIHHNLPLEVTWSIIPLAITCYMFWIGFRGFMDQYNPPSDGLNVQVQAQKWNWTFIYPDGTTSGGDGSGGDDDGLHVPVGKNVILTMTSSDVLHSFFVPDFRIKKDVVPGRYHKIWFNAPETGKHRIFCTEYCGTGHSLMYSQVVVQNKEDYEAWLKKAGALDDIYSPVDAGEKWYKNLGCVQCHTTDGKTSTGPSWKNLWGSTQTMSDGSTVTVDENYVHESVLNPSAKVVSGFQNVMPSFQGRLEDKSIRSIIAYMKSLSDKTSPEELEELKKVPAKDAKAGAVAPAASTPGAAGAPAGSAAPAAPPAATPAPGPGQSAGSTPGGSAGPGGGQ